MYYFFLIGKVRGKIKPCQWTNWTLHLCVHSVVLSTVNNKIGAIFFFYFCFTYFRFRVRGTILTYQSLKFSVLECSCSVYFVNESFSYLRFNSLLSTGSNIIGIYCRLFTPQVAGHDFVLLTNMLLCGTCWYAAGTSDTALFPSVFPQTLVFAKWTADSKIYSVQGIFKCL